MKRLLLIIAISLFSFPILAQQKLRSLSVEILGAQNTIGLNYDSRFHGNACFGYRLGLGMGYSEESGLLNQKIKGVGAPLELNYLMGKKNKKLELGAGVSLGVYHVNEGYFSYSDAEGNIVYSEASSNRFGYFFFGNIGYRYQRKNGFLFRMGLSPSFNFGDEYGLHKSAFYPYVGLGWSF